MTTPTFSPAAVRDALHVDGTTVLVPGDPGYDEARQIPTVVDRRPSAVVRPTDATGAARAVRFAADTGAELSVRAGGHSTLGLGRADGALTIDLRGIAGVAVDPATRTAWAGGGVTAGVYADAVGEHGLVTPFGDARTVGVGGITLGGGFGLLCRRYGLTTDSLVAAEVITAAGEVVLADAEHHPDLFWGLRGGGGNLGVVTRFRFALHDLPTVVGGTIVLPATPDAVADLVALAQAAPRELSAILTVCPMPPLPDVPAELHGRPVVMAAVCWSGPVEEADQALAGVRDVAARAGGALADSVRTARYCDLLEPAPPAAASVVTRPFFADGVDRATAEQVVEQVQVPGALMRAVQLRVLGGAVADVPVDATAFAHRTQPVLGVVMAMAPTPPLAEAERPWVQALADVVRAGDDAVYGGFVVDGDPQALAAAYPGATGERLARVKRSYDPHNLFRANLNVPPAG
ncbi:FAD-binding oxidoreductase [Puerhibacterium puerhi]|uniref:FAD-binding oxidoreductase n=1 Tax=Puerhibacterium puerhi TaxID=2692623 RepID=UPI00135C16BD|nr:FAD-binding oxidoreductase [Puerhibacterium puerhi]